MKQKILKVCLISNEFPSLEGTGGIGTYTYNLAKGLGKNGHKVFVITSNLNITKDKDFTIIPLKNSGKKWIILKDFFNKCKLPHTFNSLEFSFRSYLAVRKLNKFQNLDIIEGPEWQAQLFFLSVFLKIPIVIRLHTYTKKILELENISQNLDFRIINFLEKFTLKRARMIFAASQLIKDDAVKDLGLNPDKIYKLGLPVNVSLFSGKRTSQSFPVVLYTGRFEIKKGILDLFNTMTAVKKHFPEVIYKFVGRDSLYSKSQTVKQYLLALAGKKGLLPNIKFVDETDYLLLPKHFLSSTVFVNASRYESFGMTILEALATNTPVIIYKSAGIADIISENNLGTVIKKEKHNLASAIITALKKRTNKNTSKFIEEHLSSEKIALETIKMYRNVV